MTRQPCSRSRGLPAPHTGLQYGDGDWPTVKINEHIVETILMRERLLFPPDLVGVAEIAGGHHETMDGKGSPRGLGAVALSVNAHITAIADIFEALAERDRPYKRAHRVSEALAIMRTLCARQVIDADLFELFVACRAWHEDAPCSADAAVEDWAMPTSTAPSAIIGPFRPHDPSP